MVESVSKNIRGRAVRPSIQEEEAAYAASQEIEVEEIVVDVCSADEWDSTLSIFKIQAQTNKVQTETNTMFTRRLDGHSEKLDVTAGRLDDHNENLQEIERT